MLLDYNTYVAYICPYCGKITGRMISIFDISKNGLQLNCTDNGCGAKIASIRLAGDKYIVETECNACGGKHRVKLRRGAFWKKKQTVISCPETLMEILFIGAREDVFNAVKEQEKFLLETEAEIYSDPALSIYFDLIGAVNNIAKNNNVTCSVCGSHKADVRLIDEGIQIVCRGCGADRIYKVDTATLNELLKTGTIVLE